MPEPECEIVKSPARKRHLLVVALILLLPAILLATAWRDRHREHPYSFAGLPRATMVAWTHYMRVLPAAGHVVGYSEWRRNPLWVSYRLETGAQRVGPRPEQFSVDRRTWVRVQPDALRGTGFTRGHLAPNYAIARVHGPRAQRETFRMSNIAPQSRALNTRLWQRIEELEIDVYTPAFGRLWVVTGPVFAADGRRLPSGVEVPTHFYKIWLAETGQGPQALAFLVPQEVSGFESLEQFVVSIDAIERRTGLDFFHRLADPAEDAMEAMTGNPRYELHRHAERPPRY